MVYLRQACLNARSSTAANAENIPPPALPQLHPTGCRSPSRRRSCRPTNACQLAAWPAPDCPWTTPHCRSVLQRRLEPRVSGISLKVKLGPGAGFASSRSARRSAAKVRHALPHDGLAARLQHVATGLAYCGWPPAVQPGSLLVEQHKMFRINIVLLASTSTGS